MLMLTLLGILFRIQNSSDSIFVMKHLFQLSLPKLKKFTLIFLFGYIFLFELMQMFQITDKGHCLEKISSFYIRVTIILFMIFMILLTHSKPTVAFQYFQF